MTMSVPRAKYRCDRCNLILDDEVYTAIDPDTLHQIVIGRCCALDYALIGAKSAHPKVSERARELLHLLHVREWSRNG